MRRRTGSDADVPGLRLRRGPLGVMALAALLSAWLLAPELQDGFHPLAQLAALLPLQLAALLFVFTRPGARTIRGAEPPGPGLRPPASG
jgi:hypothetical protein